MKEYSYIELKDSYAEEFPRAVKLLQSSIWGRYREILRILELVLESYPITVRSKQDLDIIYRLLEGDLRNRGKTPVLITADPAPAVKKKSLRAAKKKQPEVVFEDSEEAPTEVSEQQTTGADDNPFSMDNILQVDF